MYTLDLNTQHEVQQLHLRYAQALDRDDLSSWPDLFTPECLYTIQSRENHAAGLPLCILRLESQGMLRDRIYGVSKTIYHDPYYQRHIVSQPLLTSASEAGIEAETAFLVIRTHRDRLPAILSTGRYLDRIVRLDGALRFSQRCCIFDNDLIANSIIKPI